MVKTTPKPRATKNSSGDELEPPPPPPLPLLPLPPPGEGPPDDPGPFTVVSVVVGDEMLLVVESVGLVDADSNDVEVVLSLSVFVRVSVAWRATSRTPSNTAGLRNVILALSINTREICSVAMGAIHSSRWGSIGRLLPCCAWASTEWLRADFRACTVGRKTRTKREKSRLARERRPRRVEAFVISESLGRSGNTGNVRPKRIVGRVMSSDVEKGQRREDVEEGDRGA